MPSPRKGGTRRVLLTCYWVRHGISVNAEGARHKRRYKYLCKDKPYFHGGVETRICETYNKNQATSTKNIFTPTQRHKLVRHGIVMSLGTTILCPLPPDLRGIRRLRRILNNGIEVFENAANAPKDQPNFWPDNHHQYGNHRIRCDLGHKRR